MCHVFSVLLITIAQLLTTKRIYRSEACNAVFIFVSTEKA
jgi:hypothetical protein